MTASREVVALKDGMEEPEQLARGLPLENEAPRKHKKSQLTFSESPLSQHRALVTRTISEWWGED